MGTRVLGPRDQSLQHCHYLSYGDRSHPLTIDENGGPGAPESIGFTGERGNLDTNLRYLNARWYPASGPVPDAGLVGPDHPQRRRQPLRLCRQ